jgi:hypothetical protein
VGQTCAIVRRNWRANVSIITTIMAEVNIHLTSQVYHHLLAKPHITTENYTDPISIHWKLLFTQQIRWILNLTLYLPCIFKWDVFKNHQLMHINYSIVYS